METLQRFRPSWYKKSFISSGAFMYSVVNTGMMTRQEAWEAVIQFRLGQAEYREDEILNSRLFGINQLNDLACCEDYPICIVESEDAAIFCSQKVDRTIWMASGEKNALTLDMLKDLVGYRVILYPNTDPKGETYLAWNRIAREAQKRLGLKVRVVDILEKYATAEQKERRIDVMDFILEDEEYVSKGSKGSRGSKGSKGSRSSRGSRCSRCSRSARGSKSSKGFMLIDMRPFVQMPEWKADPSAASISMSAFGPVMERGGPT